MTNSEFSNQFDTLTNSYAIAAGVDGRYAAFDEYEKSVFLTKAQEELVLSLYSGKNVAGEGFEQTEELRRYLSPLIYDSDPLSPTSNSEKFGVQSFVFDLPPELWFITYESVVINNEGKCNNGSTLDVIPVTQDELHRIKRNPFRGCNDRRALRLDYNNNQVEILCKYNVDSYFIRYLKKLTPIILEKLDDDLTIEGESIKTPCELHESLHKKILDIAVLRALQSRNIGVQPQQQKTDKTE